MNLILADNFFQIKNSALMLPTKPSIYMTEAKW